MRISQRHCVMGTKELQYFIVLNILLPQHSKLFGLFYFDWN